MKSANYDNKEYNYKLDNFSGFIKNDVRRLNLHCLLNLLNLLNLHRF